MTEWITEFKEYLEKCDMSENTIVGYIHNVKQYLRWFDESKGVPFTRLYRENVKEFISFLKTIKKSKPKTINTKINALVKFNEFLMESDYQHDMVINKNDFQKVQQQYASLAKLSKKDVEKFRQLILQSGNKRNFALVTLLAYAGLRLSEALDLKLEDVNFREIIVEGKGDKFRIVYMNDKVKEALSGYLKVRDENIECDYFFVSKRKTRINRTTINKMFNDFSKKLEVDITPHDLRHFFCSHALESGMSIHEVANQAGHSNIHTTMLYTNPSKQELINKMNQL